MIWRTRAGDQLGTHQVFAVGTSPQMLIGALALARSAETDFTFVLAYRSTTNTADGVFTTRSESGAERLAALLGAKS